MWAGIGLATGVVATFVFRAHQPLGGLGTTILSILGAMAGGYASTFFSLDDFGEFDWLSIAITIGSAAAALTLVSIIRK